MATIIRLKYAIIHFHWQFCSTDYLVCHCTEMHYSSRAKWKQKKVYGIRWLRGYLINDCEIIFMMHKWYASPDQDKIYMGCVSIQKSFLYKRPSPPRRNDSSWFITLLIYHNTFSFSQNKRSKKHYYPRARA